MGSEIPVTRARGPAAASQYIDLHLKIAGRLAACRQPDSRGPGKREEMSLYPIV